MNEKDELADVKVFRFDPQLDKEPRYEVYRVPYKGCTVFDVLRYIYEQRDASLAFRSGCSGRGAPRCGACAVLVNGTAALCCARTAEKQMTIEPHPKFRLIKDLVVDFNSVGRKKQGGQTIYKIMVDEDKCVGCGDCVYMCPAQVYEVKKRKDGKLKAVPVDVESCCGSTCLLCTEYCWKEAITVKSGEFVSN